MRSLIRCVALLCQSTQNKVANIEILRASRTKQRVPTILALLASTSEETTLGTAVTTERRKEREQEWRNGHIPYRGRRCPQGCFSRRPHVVHPDTPVLLFVPSLGGRRTIALYTNENVKATQRIIAEKSVSKRYVKNDEIRMDSVTAR